MGLLENTSIVCIPKIPYPEMFRVIELLALLCAFVPRVQCSSEVSNEILQKMWLFRTGRC